MNQLFTIIKEYIFIVEQLTLLYPVENDRIIIDRNAFKQTLEQNGFASFTQKIEVYKDLGFIIFDNNNYTMPYKDKELKKTVRKVIINYKTYKTVSKSCSINI